MNPAKKLYRRPEHAFCPVLALAALVSSGFTQQSGGPYTLNPTLIPGGGGASSNGNIEGSSGQYLVSSSNRLALQVGFE
jgi:hypothetical protein